MFDELISAVDFTEVLIAVVTIAALVAVPFTAQRAVRWILTIISR